MNPEFSKIFAVHQIASLEFSYLSGGPILKWMSGSQRIKKDVISRHLETSSFFLLLLARRYYILNQCRWLIWITCLSFILHDFYSIIHFGRNWSTLRTPIWETTELHVSIEHFHAGLVLLNSIFAQIVIEITELGSEHIFVRQWTAVLFLVVSHNFSIALGTIQSLISNYLRLWWCNSTLLKDWSTIVNFLKYWRL